MPKVEFIAVNQTGQRTERRILVFLWPQTVPDGAVFYAWQLLSPPLGGGQQRFEYGGGMEVRAEDLGGRSRSALAAAAPGSSFEARSGDGQGPQLVFVDRSGSGGAAGVKNTTGAPLRVIWYSGGWPFMEQRHVLPGETASLELRCDLLLFNVAVPSPTGRYSAEEVAGAPYRYVIPRFQGGALPKTVHVIWQPSMRLEFQPPSGEPPSAPPPPAVAREEGSGATAAAPPEAAPVTTRKRKAGAQHG